MSVCALFLLRQNDQNTSQSFVAFCVDTRKGVAHCGSQIGYNGKGLPFADQSNKRPHHP